MNASPATVASVQPARAIKCGRCKEYHPSVAAVRACHTSGTQVIVNRPEAASPATSSVPASERQLQFIADLAAKLGETAPTPRDRSHASELIDQLKGRRATLPTVEQTMRSTAPVAALPEVPAGYYAIEVDGTVKFYRVDRPTEGRWAGRTFVKVQASDDLHPVRGEGARKVLEAIAVDPKAASLRYGREIGRCGVCNRTLTDETSRANGIGPICADKAGW